MGTLRDREVASDRQSSNFESCVWRAVSSHSSDHHQKFLLAQFSLHAHKGGLKPIHFVRIAILFLEGQSGVRTRDLPLSKQAALTTAPGPPPYFVTRIIKSSLLHILLGLHAYLLKQVHGKNVMIIYTTYIYRKYISLTKKN